MAFPGRSCCEGRGWRRRNWGRGGREASAGTEPSPPSPGRGASAKWRQTGRKQQMRASGGAVPGRRAALALGAASVLAAPAALAQGKFPDRPIRLIVPWPPGGSADAQLRSLAEIAGRKLGQNIVVE